MSAAAGSGAGEASQNDDADLQLLAAPQVRVSQWINSALAHLTEGSDPSSSVSSSTPAAEAAVGRLYVRVKAHERSVEAATEDYVRLSLSRLPRAAMELEQMVSETEQVTQELQRLNEIVVPSASGAASGQRAEGGEDKAANGAGRDAASLTPAAEAAASASAHGQASQQQQQREKHLRELHTLKSLHDKLKRCSDTLGRASRVEEQIRRLDKGIREFHERGKSSLFASVPDLAKCLESVQQDLAELRQIDPHFGERHKAAVEQYEGFVELALEEECLRYLKAHDVLHATSLFSTLSAIGRVDAVLTSYVQHAAHRCTGALEKTFQTSSSAPSGDKAVSAASAPAVSAEVAVGHLKTTLLPALLTALEEEADFLQRLAASIDTEEAGLSSSGPSAPLSAASEAQTEVRHGDRGEGAGDASPRGDGTPAAGAAAARTSVGVGKVRDVLKSLLVHISATLEFAIKPILLSEPTTNAQRIELYEVVRQAVVTRRRPATPHADTPTTATAAGGTSSSSLPSQQVFTSQVLTALVSVFHQPDVLRVFCKRLDSTHLALHVASADPDKSTVDSTQFTADLTRSLTSVDALIAWVEKVTLGEALRYFPDQVLPLCVSQWRQAFTDALRPVLSSKGDPADDAGEAVPDTVQGALLAQLVFADKAMKPRLERAKQYVEDQLSVPSVQQRYPVGVTVTSTTLAEQLWSPLQAQLNAREAECKARVQATLLRPVSRKTDGYAHLPTWSVTVPAASADPADLSPSVETDFQRSHASPTALVRELGEAIMELPLALESLSSLDMLRLTPVPVSASASSASDGSARGDALRMAEAVEELASDWLDGLVRRCVGDFLVNKLGRVHITVEPASGLGDLTADQKVRVLQCVTEALLQLQADLEYLQNVLSAVSEESFDELECALGALHTMIPATEVKSIAISDAIAL